MISFPQILLCTFYCFTYTALVGSHLAMLRWVGYVVRMEMADQVHKVFLGRPHGQSPNSQVVLYSGFGAV